MKLAYSSAVTCTAVAGCHQRGCGMEPASRLSALLLHFSLLKEMPREEKEQAAADKSGESTTTGVS